MAIRVNFGDIMQAIEDKLVADGVVTSADQVSWAVNDVLPQLACEKDILLRARTASRMQEDGGVLDLRYSRILDVCIRSQAVMDPGASNKTWIKAHFVWAEQILGSIGGSEFIPQDNLGNSLTTQSIMPVNDLAPQRPAGMAMFGDSVCSLEITYLPLIAPNP
jgi:hypothetical protein